MFISNIKLFTKLIDTKAKIEVKVTPELLALDNVHSALRFWVKKELSEGNQWAWCRVKVTATFAGFVGVDEWDSCIYSDIREFLELDLPKMQETAIADLLSQLLSTERFPVRAILLAVLASCGIDTAAREELPRPPDRPVVSPISTGEQTILIRAIDFHQMQDYMKVAASWIKKAEFELEKCPLDTAETPL